MILEEGGLFRVIVIVGDCYGLNLYFVIGCEGNEGGKVCEGEEENREGETRNRNQY